MVNKPFSVKDMEQVRAMWKQEFKRRQMEAFKRKQLKRAKEEAYWSYVMSGVID